MILREVRLAHEVPSSLGKGEVVGIHRLHLLVVMEVTVDAVEEHVEVSEEA